MLAVTGTAPVTGRQSCPRIARRSRSAQPNASSGAAPGITSRNSSPPSRAANASLPGAAASFSNSATRRSTSSPTSCEHVSLIRLKWSRSTIAIDNGVCASSA